MTSSALPPEPSPVTVRRSIDLPIGVGEAWPALTGADALGEWLGDAVDLELRPGAAGGLIDDDGDRRTVVVREVEPQQRVSFTWWRDDDPGVASTVELVLVPTAAGSRLTVTETMSMTVMSMTVMSMTVMSTRATAGDVPRLLERAGRAVLRSRALSVCC
jgi:uncharacterized protein YndB with AHSA1/START domain